MSQIVDDLGLKVEVPGQPRRIVSMVPSWTETLFALGLDSEIVGVTRFCVEPAAATERTKIGGTKNPDLRKIMELNPDFVVANAEENQREHLDILRGHGVPVFITYPRTITGAVESIFKLGSAVGRDDRARAMVRDITLRVSEIEAKLGVWSKLRIRVFCPIWKNPWMAFNADTYAHDVLRLLGFNNVFASAGERYPRTTLELALERRPDVVLLPDEPYRFDPADAEELKLMLPPGLGRRVVLCSGRDLHWYGAHMLQGLESIAALTSRVRAALIA